MANETALSVGMTLSVAVGEPATYDSAGFEALSWTEITDVENVPEFGGSAEVAEFTPLASGVIDKGKGSINYGDTTIPIRRRITDVGQDMLQSGFDGTNRDEIHSVRLSHPSHGNLYFTAVISGFTYNPNDANSWYRGNVTFAVRTKPLPDADVYTVTFLPGTNGSLIGVTEQIVLAGGDCSPVYADADTDFTFDGWSGDNTSSDNPLTVTNVTADMTITATWV